MPILSKHLFLAAFVLPTQDPATFVPETLVPAVLDKKKLSSDKQL